ncbi:hypothetical protein, partial [Ancylomarina longa]
LQTVTYLEENKKTFETERAKLNMRISELAEQLQILENECSKNVVLYDSIFAERTDLYAKIKELKEELLKRDQTAQTIHLNKPKEFKFYHPKEGLGFDNPH